MGYSEARNVKFDSAIREGRIFGDRIADSERTCVVRDVSGLKPWELAKARATRRAVRPAKSKKASSRSEAAKKAWVTIRARKAAKAGKVRKK